jgi:hypothetical protein
MDSITILNTVEHCHLHINEYRSYTLYGSCDANTTRAYSPYFDMDSLKTEG